MNAILAGERRTLQRDEMYARLRAHGGPWDMLVVGGGATGVGVALDAASRGHEVLLLEQHDFGKGASSRSTKLIHGGVRYLEQGNIPLVMEALRERGLLLANAPHLVHDMAFVVPNYDWWEAPFYGIGLKVYNLLAGKYGFGASRILSKTETLELLPTIKTEGLRGGVVYYDGQFDDSRLLIDMVTTAYEHGATLLNYVAVTGLTRDADGFIDGVTARDTETGEELHMQAGVVINATGPFTDALRQKSDASSAPMIAPSQGIHLVFDRSFLPGNSAIMVPHTSDGRVMFAIPWHGHTLVGTTDTPIDTIPLEPIATGVEIDFILSTASLYLAKKPAREDILSVFAGVRPLVKSGGAGSTATLSRGHDIRTDEFGLLTICGGKWTTYRHMAEDCVNRAAVLARLEDRPCVTESLRIHGPDAAAMQALIADRPELAAPLDASLPYTGANVVWAVRNEMARAVEDVLARRTRALFLNARAAMRMAPQVARLMAPELGGNHGWQSGQIERFLGVARNYLPASAV